MSLNFSHIKGDTFDQVNFELKINDVLVDLTGAIIQMQLRSDIDDATPSLSWTSVGNAGITINGPTIGQFKINQQIINIPYGEYLYDINIIFPNGVVKTYVQGIFSIVSDITH